MKKAQAKHFITVDIQSLSHDGRGITNINGKTTFVSGALATEKVTCKIIKEHRTYNEAEILDVLTPAIERVQPECAHYGVCGGCSMQHLEINAQIQLKQKTLLEQLHHFGKVKPETILPPLSGNPWGYRRKARLGVRFAKELRKLQVGFRKKNSNSLTDIDSCPILHPHIGTRITAVRELIASLTQYENIPQIEVSVSDTQTALVFRNLVTLPEDDIKKLIAFGQTQEFQIYLQPNSPAPIQKLWPADKNERLVYSLPDYQLNMPFHPLDFIQVNGEVNPLMIKQALALLDPQSNEKILDLFCGLGNFTLPIARSAQQVTGIEGSQEMVSRATENAAHNQISNADFYTANLMSPPPQVSWMRAKYDKILLDPPRTGAKEIIQLFPALAPKRIVYVSCNPATLARDAKDLVYNQGYKLKKVGVVNMFPHTSHIEAIAMFEK